MRRVSSYFFPLFVSLVYAFLYVPLIVLIIFSFNNNRFRFDWVGFTTKWYSMLWQSSEIWHAFYNSFTIALATVFLCLSMSALFIFFGSNSFVRKMLSLFYLNLAIPEIVMAVGLMSLFNFYQIPLSLATLIAAHTILGLGYVVPILYDRYVELDKKYLEASRDLGATSWQTFTWVVLPLLFPALFASALLVFIISFDDFVLSFFCSGGATQTLPMYIFAGIRAGTSPVISALSTVLLVLSSVMVLVFLSFSKSRMVR